MNRLNIWGMVMKNRITNLWLLLFTAAAWCQPSFAEDNIADKAINEQRVSKLAIYGSAQTNKNVSDKTVLGEEAKRIVSNGSGNPWDAAVQSTTTGKIKSGDQIICVAFLKAVDTANNAPAKVTLRLQESAAPYADIKTEEITISKEWSQYQFTAVVNKDYGKGDAAFVVQLNYGAQTIDVGPLFILNVNKTTKGSR